MERKGDGTNTAITVCSVPGERPWKVFLDAPARIYRDDPLWVRPLDFERKPLQIKWHNNNSNTRERTYGRSGQ